MAKIQLMWKDPDWYDNILHGKHKIEGEAAQEEFFAKAHAAGLGEYLDVELDTETGVAKIVGSH